MVVEDLSYDYNDQESHKDDDLLNRLKDPNYSSEKRTKRKTRKTDSFRNKPSSRTSR